MVLLMVTGVIPDGGVMMPQDAARYPWPPPLFCYTRLDLELARPAATGWHCRSQ